MPGGCGVVGEHMTPFTTILTHPGGAHKDEFLACSVLLAVHAVPIVRREPVAGDLTNPATCVVDVGHVHDPAVNNFDHHQLPKDLPPTCALSLVLQHLGLYGAARKFCDWLETAEWFDCRGPFETARWLGVNREVLERLNSPLDATLLRGFSQASRLEPGEPLWEMMRLTGTDLIAYIRSSQSQLDFLEQHAEFWTLDLPNGPALVLFLSRSAPLPADPAAGTDRFIAGRGLTDRVVGLVYPDDRGTGYSLRRFRDEAQLDFTRIAGDPGVHFAHARGFVAKTSVQDVTRLKALLIHAGTEVGDGKAGTADAPAGL